MSLTQAPSARRLHSLLAIAGSGRVELRRIKGVDSYLLSRVVECAIWHWSYFGHRCLDDTTTNRSSKTCRNCDSLHLDTFITLTLCLIRIISLAHSLDGSINTPHAIISLSFDTLIIVSLDDIREISFDQRLVTVQWDPWKQEEQCAYCNTGSASQKPGERRGQR